MLDVAKWVADCLSGFVKDPADTDYQRGYQAAVVELGRVLVDVGSGVRLYRELHITVEPKGSWEEFKALMDIHEWRASRFDEDLVDNYSGKWFISQRTEDAAQCTPMIKAMVVVLGNFAYTVLRWKAEDTLLDSKYGDIL